MMVHCIWLNVRFKECDLTDADRRGLCARKQASNLENEGASAEKSDSDLQKREQNTAQLVILPRPRSC